MSVGNDLPFDGHNLRARSTSSSSRFRENVRECLDLDLTTSESGAWQVGPVTAKSDRQRLKVFLVCSD